MALYVEEKIKIGLHAKYLLEKHFQKVAKKKKK